MGADQGQQEISESEYFDLIDRTIEKVDEVTRIDNVLSENISPPPAKMGREEKIRYFIGCYQKKISDEAEKGKWGTEILPFMQ